MSSPNPGLNVIERFLVGNIIHEDDTLKKSHGCEVNKYIVEQRIGKNECVKWEEGEEEEEDEEEKKKEQLETN